MSGGLFGVEAGAPVTDRRSPGRSIPPVAGIRVRQVAGYVSRHPGLSVMQLRIGLHLSHQLVLSALSGAIALGLVHQHYGLQPGSLTECDRQPCPGLALQPGELPIWPNDERSAPGGPGGFPPAP